MNNDRLMAAVEAIARAGADDFELGFLDDDVPMEDARWWAKAQWKGTRVQVDDQAGPDVAAEALAKKVLQGGQCVRCGFTITLDLTGPGCRWRRRDAHWLRGCDGGHEPIGPPNRAQRRRQDQVRKLRRGN